MPSVRHPSAPHRCTTDPPAIFSKSYCPYCTSAKRLLTELGATFHAVELDHEADGSAIQGALAGMTQQSTVPNIFIGQKHIGGNSDLQAIKAQLPELLKAAGAV
jgi:glutaredoxin 3